MSQDLLNRLKKNHRRLVNANVLKSTTAYRLYDRDIPEFPFLIEVFHDMAVIWERFDEKKDDPDSLRESLASALLGIQTEGIFPLKAWTVKSRVGKVDRKRQQYNRSSDQEQEQRIWIEEGKVSYQVELKRAIDVGLFLDHRPLRLELQKGRLPFQKVSLNRAKLLNLFCYTGSVSVAAAMGGFQTTSVDMSNTYLDWARKNFIKNNFEVGREHQLIKSDVESYLSHLATRRPRELYDLVFIDPPAFSINSSKQILFDVQRDHERLIRAGLQALRDSDSAGVFFSTHLRKFKLASAILDEFSVRDLSQTSLPPDFRDTKAHHLFWIQNASSKRT